MKVKEYITTSLIEAEYNPRKLSKKAEQQLTDSLKRFGFVDPIIINVNAERQNIVIGGHQRLKIAKKLGFEKVPCVELDLSLEKEKELNIRLNKNSGAFDDEVLKEYFNAEDLSAWGFDDKEIQFFNVDDDQNEDKEPEVEFSEYLQETNQYIVLLFDNEVDWVSAQTHFDLKTVKSTRRNGSEWSRGIGRVIKGAEYLARIKGGIQ